MLSTEEAARFLNAIPTDSLVDLRDRVFIGMAYTFARVGAVVRLPLLGDPGRGDSFRSRLSGETPATSPRHQRLVQRWKKGGDEWLTMPCGRLYASQLGRGAKNPRHRLEAIRPVIERLGGTASALVYLASLQLLLRRLARP
jgi:hypothetical protein